MKTVNTDSKELVAVISDTDIMINDFIKTQKVQNDRAKLLSGDIIGDLKKHSNNNDKIKALKEDNEKILLKVNNDFKKKFNKLKSDTVGSVSNKELIKMVFTLIINSDKHHKDTLKVIDTLKFYYESNFYIKNHLSYKVLKNLKRYNKFVTKSALNAVYGETILIPEDERALWDKSSTLKTLNGAIKQLSETDIQLLTLYTNIIDSKGKINLQYFNTMDTILISKIIGAIALSKDTKQSLKVVFEDVYKLTKKEEKTA